MKQRFFQMWLKSDSSLHYQLTLQTTLVRQAISHPAAHIEEKGSLYQLWKHRGDRDSTKDVGPMKASPLQFPTFAWVHHSSLGSGASWLQSAKHSFTLHAALGPANSLPHKIIHYASNIWRKCLTPNKFDSSLKLKHLDFCHKNCFFHFDQCMHEIVISFDFLTLPLCHATLKMMNVKKGVYWKIFQNKQPIVHL